MDKAVYMRFKMISIIGVDGSGKTTQANLLIHQLRLKGIPVKYVWFRYNHLLSLIPLIYARIFGYTIYEKHGENLNGRHEFYRSCFLSKVYPITLFIDMTLSYLIKIAIPKKMGNIFVSDRCIYDTIVDLMIDLDNLNFLDSFIGTFYRKIVPSWDTKVFFLDIDESLIVERRPELLFDTSLKKRRLAYQIIAEQFPVTTIMNDGEIHETNEKILKSLNN